MLASVTLGVFVLGLIVSNWAVLRAKLPTYYPNCAWARAAGAAPIKRGSPGYRVGLDADDDGVACEQYRKG
ncbi:excalibur calcium-binding domain-containing protein [Sphingomonas sp. BN140010]|uniref:Excalibur calcium-binding domain-containing protein n=1 Tax=Sphingomonas arvum TaxID=2992113 RepID=A0ABT3JEP5_9SPHN|nr:excalibur calcium-binding domain-containing protein [Sphingomonas sp. BN140010]MCW3797404.1 excalibur calcium-binding domain-containing protein [Sphingomonas sp. BN140010]